MHLYEFVLVLTSSVPLGVQIDRVGLAISFTQRAWLAPYIAFNTTKRQAAASPFERSFYKQLNNRYFKMCLYLQRLFVRTTNVI